MDVPRVRMKASPAPSRRASALHLGSTIASAGLALAVLGCASSQGPDSPAPAPAAAETRPADSASTPAPAPEAGSARDAPRDRTGAAPVSSPPSEGPPDADAEPGLLELCRIQPPQEATVDQARKLLQETFCGATLWLDGLLGGGGDVSNARRTSGRVEIGAEHSDFHGFEPHLRLRLRYALPTLSERLSVFLGRTDPSGYIQDREEAFALRTSTLDRRAAEKWLTGLGYAPPGRWAQDVDLSLGAKPGTSPTVFARARYERNVRVTDVSLWRFRETLFWDGREGFGATTAIEYDRLLTETLLLHWRSVATLSEASAGVAWRSATVAYQNLGRQRGVAGEVFLLGATSAPIPLLEYGFRMVYRHPLRPHLFVELVAGHSWPRHDWQQERAGSPLFGLVGELHFGTTPFE